MSPVIFINVLDKTKHKTSVSGAQITVTDHMAIIKEDVLLDTLTVKSADASVKLQVDTDYTAAFDDNGTVIITTSC